MDEQVGKYLRDRRVAAHLSLRAVAAKLGVSHVFLGEVERGRKALPVERWADMEAAVPGVSRNDLEEFAREQTLPRAVQMKLREAGRGYETIGALLYRRAQDRTLSDVDIAEAIRLLKGEP